MPKPRQNWLKNPRHSSVYVQYYSGLDCVVCLVQKSRELTLLLILSCILKDGNPLDRNASDAAKLAAKVEAKKKAEAEAEQAASGSSGGGPPPPRKAKAKKQDPGLDDLLNAGLSSSGKKKGVKA